MRTLPITLLALAVVGIAGGAGAPSYGNAESIGEDELKNYLYFLASDELEGRSLPSRGFDTAALYVASHLAEWDLRPVAGAANTHGPLQPYFMPMELLAKTVVPAESKASMSGGRGRGASQPVELAYGRDWIVAAGGRGVAPLEPFEAAGNLVFAGNGYTVVKGNIDPWAGLDVKGAIVVVAGLPPELAAQQAAGRGAGGRGAPNPLGENCKDFLTPEEAAAKNGAVAVVTIANYQQLTAMASPAAAPLNGPVYRVPKLAKQGC